MANDNALRFVRNLFAACPNYRMPKQERDEAMKLYVDKLSRWRMPERIWASVISRIVSDNDGNLPPLSVIYGYLKEASTATGESSETICQTFDIGKLQRYVRARDTGRTDPHTKKAIYEIVSVNPSNPPALPDGATNEHICIPPKMQVQTERATKDEGRAAWLQGWLGSGAPGELCLKYFEVVRGK
jgi:hypothetical protein